MPNIDLTKASLDELERLNGEVGKVRKTLIFESESLKEISTKRENSQKEFDADLLRKSSQLKRVDDQVVSREADLEEVRKEIILGKETRDRQLSEIADHKDRIEKDRIKKEEDSRILNERKESLDRFESSLKDREKNLLLCERESEAKLKLIRNKEEILAGDLLKFEEDKREIVSLKKKYIDGVSSNDEVKRVFLGREIEIEKRESAVKEERDLNSQEKERIKSQEIANINKERDLKIREDGVSSSEKVLNRREDSVIKRETGVLLREDECRVREKALNIANRDKQLDDKSISTN